MLGAAGVGGTMSHAMEHGVGRTVGRSAGEDAGEDVIAVLERGEEEPCRHILPGRKFSGSI